MAVTSLLYRLEQLDSQIEQQRAALDDLRRRQARHPELDHAESHLEALRTKEHRASATQRSHESDLAAIQQKLDRDQARMYGGTIVDAASLRSLEREIAHLQAQRSEVEDRLLAAMEELETLQAQVAEESRRTHELRHHWEEDRPALAQQAAGVTSSLAGLQEERDGVAASLDARTLDQYRRLRASLGHAVSAVSNGVCSACRVNLPPKDVQHARSGTIALCTNCGRILYAGG